MNIKARVVQTQITSDGRFLAKLQFNGKLPKENTTVEVHFGSKRSLAQNRLYFAFLRWLIDDGGLKDHGHFSEIGLHESLKQHFLSDKIMTRGQFVSIENPEDLTTTTMNKSTFGEYIENINIFMSEFFNVNTAAFWEGRERG